MKLPTHRAINVWVAEGAPRGGFLGATLPMEGLRRDELADYHLEAQRERGGHHPEHLPDPLRDLLTRKPPASSRGDASSQARSRRGRPGAGKNGKRGDKQLTFIDVTEADDRDGL